MNIRVELSPEMEARLNAEARAKGLPVERLEEQLLKSALTIKPTPTGRLSIEEFHRMLEGIAEGSEKLPELPTERFSREYIYEDRLNCRDPVPPR
jgi:hypothetical protein